MKKREISYGQGERRGGSLVGEASLNGEKSVGES